MTKIRLLSDSTIGLVDYSKGDVIDVAGVTADKLIDRERAELVMDEDIIPPADDPIVNNYRADQPLEDPDDN
jgi:hypothetical protein